MTIDFPKNVGHVPDYENLKEYVYSNLVRNTTLKDLWEQFLSEACRLWPTAAEYLQVLARERTRWGAPWRLENFTVGYEASSAVEGSFSSFQRALGDAPKSFTGVVQCHVQKDMEKLREEKRTLVNLQMLATDETLLEKRSDPAKECATVYSHETTERFEIANQEAQNYEPLLLDLTQEQISRGVTCAHSVSRRALLNREKPPPPRIVEEIDGIKYCSCLKDVNNGETDKHIQCVLGGKFVASQFHSHFAIAKSVSVAPKVDHISQQETHCDPDEDDFATGTADDEDMFETGYRDGNVDEGAGVGVFVSDLIGMTSMQNIDLPSATLSQVNRHATSKTAKLTSLQKYNAIIEEAKILASIVSSDKSKSFSKAKNILKFVRTNIQNMGGEELKAATSDYLGLKSVEVQATDNYGLSNDGDILAPVLKKTAGATSMKRKRPSSETATTSNTGHSCSLCKNKGHKMNNCKTGAKIGDRLTVSKWNDKMALVKYVGTIVASLIDPVVPSDARGLQIIGKVKIDGDEPSGTNAVYQANVVLGNLTIKQGLPCHLTYQKIGEWCGSGKSPAKFVFVKAHVVGVMPE